MALSSFFRSPVLVFTTSIVLRAVFLVYGLWQDANSPMKYTDIDYYVFTDAARYISRGQPPYARDTYRYTPLLAWLIYPTVWSGKFWFSFGKILFAVGDVATGWMMFRILKEYKKMADERALKFASIWLLNPMVATISTRGSSEGLLGVFVTALLWAVLAKKVPLAGFLLGFAVHFKIYPFIYAVSIVWFLDETRFQSARSAASQPSRSLFGQIQTFITLPRLSLAFYSLLTFTVLNLAMYQIYGWPFLEHSYLYHLIRSDHRHNFSPYNTLLYLNSSPNPSGLESDSASFELERLAFLPQLLLSAVFIPLALAKKDLPNTMLAQTFAFVTFNKVCTSQYFLWYMMFLPYYLPQSTLLQSAPIGIAAIVAWIAGQAAWLQQGFQLEFNGHSTFLPGLWLSSILFFLVNAGILSIIIYDTKQKPTQNNIVQGKKKQ
ncbi:glycosyltransferase family 50 protein [Bipolaris maydis ATCC 48331]|uniref:GPI mannosyltransferase 1 n=2 Tax=Cochliobolus heterostrophus TaxID=5016 RepID=M2U820_COCH5|nr:glycosyltransferase family 50 protein [Bipolaris maydis ATCC 48331]EMD89891.1 glycosyltransferase family 50 protein [Bipolaris maydis C5]KAH7563256.1 glycosyltransferase family 50 protein [Bipolaris maydis]ENI09896.1 glycosyltransferase family 50 protein [Bipolaris maydis ATCC 48331]KAJ5025417.1 glycosyltransferase [Bipolaris maydis]KAJ5064017.1 PIG-M-domain-containing protein [Bipolaris maydis]